MTEKFLIFIFALLSLAAPAHAIDAEYRQLLINSGCTQMSEMQGCDIYRTKDENATAGFVTEAPVEKNYNDNQTKKSPYVGTWIAVTVDSGDKVADIYIDSNEDVRVNGASVKAERIDGALVFTQGFLIYTILGDRRIAGQDYWFDTDAKTKGPINKKQ